MVKKIIQKNEDAVLTKKSHPVTQFDSKLHGLLDELRETLAYAGGLGLAAPQIGILRRVVLVTDDNDNVVEMVNPKIVEFSGSQEGFEGCLSIAGMYGLVERPMNVTVHAQDRNGKSFTYKAEGMAARCCCHEVDHLEGRLYDEYCAKLYTEAEIDEILDQNQKEYKAN